MEKLDKNIIKRIMKKIEYASKNPYIVKSLSGRQQYKIRVGDYRVIADLDTTKFYMFIESVGHRKNIYKKI